MDFDKTYLAYKNLGQGKKFEQLPDYNRYKKEIGWYEYQMMKEVIEEIIFLRVLLRSSRNVSISQNSNIIPSTKIIFILSHYQQKYHKESIQDREASSIMIFPKHHLIQK
jgi:hypothetical protein